jgi:geranyl-CoA carboxylase beta subunit
MAILQSRIDPSSEAFRANRRDMLAFVEGFRALEARVRDTSNQKLPMFQKRGQLTPRQRLAHLIDRGSPFLELSTLAGLNMHDDDGAENIMGGGTIAGIGYVSGVRAMITASDSGIKGGTIAPMGLKKSLRVQEIALKCKLPLIGLVESGGANLNYQAEIFVDGGRTFANMARLSAAGIPHITVVHGSSTAGGAYHPGLSDYVVVVK